MFKTKQKKILIAKQIWTQHNIQSVYNSWIINYSCGQNNTEMDELTFLSLSLSVWWQNQNHHHHDLKCCSVVLMFSVCWGLTLKHDDSFMVLYSLTFSWISYIFFLNNTISLEQFCLSMNFHLPLIMIW